MLAVLCGCSVRYTNLSSEGRSRYHEWPQPKYGMYRCLSALPGVPINSWDDSHIVAYTRNVVAFSGMQLGNRMQIILYTGGYGWVERDAVGPYHGARPDSTCVIPAVDIHQRPIFVIR